MNTSLLRASSILYVVLAGIFTAPDAGSQEPATAPESSVLFTNVRIFDGVDAELASGDVLVRGQKIARVSTTPIDPPAGAQVIDGGGRVLSPGFIDIQAHLTLALPFGEIREGWLADLVLIDGDPLEDIGVLTRPKETLVVIMKAGKIYKNTLTR